MSKSLYYLTIIVLLLNTEVRAQDISLFKQFNGRYDYLAIGNTLNPAENNIDRSFCEILPTSEAALNIDPASNIIAAYLYWAGSGLGDTEVSLNGNTILAEQTYNTSYTDPFFGNINYFSCYSEITSLILAERNTFYELSNLDISETLINNPGHCARRTNFAGWSIYVIYENSTLPLNQVNLFQGLEIINRNVGEKTIFLNNVNVLDNDNAKIGFLAWEGDNALNYGESLSVNGNIISNPPLNLADNAFNGTNTFINSNTFYNCDLDVYNLENNISIGDTQVEIKLTTGGLDNNGNFQADLIIINNIITVLNSQLPDATITNNSVITKCYDKTIEVNYTVLNINSTDFLPAETPIAFYIDSILVAQSETENIIDINATENGTITINIPENIADDFILTIIVDDDGLGNSTITEIIENNNTTTVPITLPTLPETEELPSLTACNTGFNSAIYDLQLILENIETTIYNNFTFYLTLEDLLNNTGEINSPSSYQSLSTHQTIYIKAEKEPCFDTYKFKLLTENCPPRIPKGFSPNNDGFNDYFNIQGLYTIFENHELLIYSRYGNLIFIGDDNNKWYGISNNGINKGKALPVGTYFYVLNLNSEKQPPITGWVYLNK